MKTLRVPAWCALFFVGGLVALVGADPAPAPAPVPPAATAAAPKAPVTPPLSPRFQLVRNRIEALFSHRLQTPAPLDPKHNPFRPAGAFVAPPSADGRSGGPVATTQENDLSLLQQSVATLKVSGVVEIGGKLHLSVNSRLFKEGDVIQTQVQGQAVYLRVRTIAPKSLTLALNEAEMTLKF